MILKQIEDFKDIYGTIWTGLIAVSEKVEYFKRMLKVTLKLYASKEHYLKEMPIPNFEIKINISQTRFEKLANEMKVDITWQMLIDSIRLDDEYIIGSNMPELISMLLQVADIDENLVTKEVKEDIQIESLDKDGKPILDDDGNPVMETKQVPKSVPITLGEKFQIVQSLE